jgi:hypothetical protein
MALRTITDDLMASSDFRPFTQFCATNAANLLFAFELARACSKLPGTLSDLHYLTQPTRTFRLPVAS